MTAYGVKNPIHTKEQSKVNNTSPDAKQYYPKDRVGNYDEWAAVEATQNHTANKMHKALEQ